MTTPHTRPNALRGVIYGLPISVAFWIIVYLLII
jgi:hypothetical protein